MPGISTLQYSYGDSQSGKFPSEYTGDQGMLTHGSEGDYPGMEGGAAPHDPTNGYGHDMLPQKPDPTSARSGYGQDALPETQDPTNPDYGGQGPGEYPTYTGEQDMSPRAPEGHPQESQYGEPDLSQHGQEFAAHSLQQEDELAAQLAQQRDEFAAHLARQGDELAAQYQGVDVGNGGFQSARENGAEHEQNGAELEQNGVIQQQTAQTMEHAPDDHDDDETKQKEAPTKQKSRKRRVVIKREPAVPQEELLKQKYAELMDMVQENVQYPEAADDLEEKFLGTVGNLLSSRPKSAKGRIETHIKIDSANDTVEYTKISDASEAEGEDGVVKKATEPAVRGRPVSAKRSQKGKRLRPKSAPAARGTDSMNFYDRFGSPDRRASSGKARYLSDASGDEWEDEPVREKRPLDAHIKNTGNPQLKNWLKLKNKLYRKNRRAEKARARQKKVVVQKEQQQRVQRQELSQVAMAEWLERKKKETRLLAQQMKQKQAQDKQVQEKAQQQFLESSLCCSAHLPPRTFSNLPAHAHLHNACCSGGTYNKSHACHPAGQSCCKPPSCCTTHPVCTSHGPPKRVPTNVCMCAHLAKGTLSAAGPTKCICGFVKSQKLREKQQLAKLAFTPGAKNPGTSIPVIPPPVQIPAIPRRPIRPSSAKPVMSRPLSGRPQSAKPALMRPSSAKKSTGRPMSAKGNKALPGRSILRTRPWSASAASRSRSPTRRQHHVELPLKKEDVENLVAKRMTYGNWVSYDNWINTTKGGDVNPTAASARARARSKSPQLSRFQKSIRKASPPRRHRSPSPKVKSYGGSRPQSAKTAFRLPSPPRSSKSPLPPLGVRFDESAGFRLPSPPQSSRTPRVVQYRKYNTQSLDIDQGAPNSLVKIIIKTSPDAIVKTTSESDQLSTEQNLPSGGSTPLPSLSMEVNHSTTPVFVQSGESTA